eukprot:3984783-Pyramimonas_sp.AAC.1
MFCRDLRSYSRSPSRSDVDRVDITIEQHSCGIVCSVSAWSLPPPRRGRESEGGRKGGRGGRGGDD